MKKETGGKLLVFFILTSIWFTPAAIYFFSQPSSDFFPPLIYMLSVPVALLVLPIQLYTAWTQWRLRDSYWLATLLTIVPTAALLYEIIPGFLLFIGIPFIAFAFYDSKKSKVPEYTDKNNKKLLFWVIFLTAVVLTLTLAIFVRLASS